ncbi:hypothetical protein ACTFIZ_006891 [Dictyostelium cf. discoideum]
MQDTSFNVHIKDEIPNYIFFIDTSGSIGKIDFEKVKLCLKKIITELPDNVNIEIIAFSSGARVISVLKCNKTEIFQDIEDNLHFDKGATNLVEALLLGKKTITNFGDNQKNYFVLLTDGVPTDDPEPIIKKLIIKGVDFIVIAIGSDSNKKEIEKLFPGQQLFIFDTFSSLSKCVKTLIPSRVTFPLHAKIYPKFEKIQKSNETFYLMVKLCSIHPKDIFHENEITLIIKDNRYYSGYEIKVGQITSEDCPSETTVKLMVRCPQEVLPTHIDFEIKVRGSTFHGRFDLKYSWFTGDFITRNQINIYVDGMAGHGKTSTLNLLFNVFSLNFDFEEFLLVGNDTDHITTEIRFQSVAHILLNKIISQSGLSASLVNFYKNIIQSLKIVFVDKPGMAKNQGNLSYNHAAKGQYSNKQQIKDLITVGEAKTFQECHAILFVISITLVDDVDLEFMKGKIQESLQAKMKPIVVVTHCDAYSPEEAEVMKKKLEGELKVDKKNFFYSTPYIQGEKQRDPIKDRIGFQILKSIVEIANNTENQKILEALAKDINNNNIDEICDSFAKTSISSTTKTNSNNSNHTSANSTPNGNPPSPLLSPNGNSSSPLLPPNSTTSESSPWTIYVKNDLTDAKVNEAKFKVFSSMTFGEFVSKVSLKFKLRVGDFSFIDENGFDLVFPDESILLSVLSDNITLSISN